ncbi:TPA: M protein trans-acting positive regulator PRD domain-containing protein [Streptococcus agalactiae]
MLFDFLEEKIKLKAYLMTALLDDGEINLDHFKTEYALSEKILQGLISELQILYSDFYLVVKSRTMVLFHYETLSKLETLHTIYRESNMLQFLAYFIAPQNVSFSEFTAKKFISVASAYRIKKNCKLYLESVKLSIQKNKVTGPEYQIRLLIALLQYHFGFIIYPFDATSEVMIRDFIEYSNFKGCDYDLKDLSEEYYYFYILVNLAWKRKEYKVEIPQTESFNQLKKSILYMELSKAAQKSIAIHLGIELNEGLLDYLYLVFCISDGPLFSNRDDINVNEEFIFASYKISKSKAFKNFCGRLLGREFIDSQHFKDINAYFLRHFICYCYYFIPDFYFLNTSRLSYSKDLYHLLDRGLADIFNLKGGNLTFSKHETVLLTMQLSNLIETFLAPLSVYVISSSNIRLQTYQVMLNQYFTSKIAEFFFVNYQTTQIDEKLLKKADIIIAERRYISSLKNDSGVAIQDILEIGMNNKQYHELLLQAIIEKRDQKVFEYISKMKHKIF